tara:strand:- start:96 stop:317 length:222 start_codon:yes stop_codon:yes gene_type:complete
LAPGFGRGQTEPTSKKQQGERLTGLFNARDRFTALVFRFTLAVDVATTVWAMGMALAEALAPALATGNILLNF